MSDSEFALVMFALTYIIGILRDRGGSSWSTFWFVMAGLWAVLSLAYLVAEGWS